MPEMVMTVNKSDIYTEPTGFIPYEEMSFDNTYFSDRNLVEEDHTKRHFATYCVLMDVLRARYLVYDRAGAEKRLHGKSSIGIGGHVNYDDKGKGRNVFEVARDREVVEEIWMEYEDALPYHLGYILSSDDDVSSVHLGVVSLYAFFNHKPIEILETSLKNPRWMSIPGLLAWYGGDKFEHWSELVIEYLFGTQYGV